MFLDVSLEKQNLLSVLFGIDLNWNLFSKMVEYDYILCRKVVITAAEFTERKLNSLVLPCKASVIADNHALASACA